MRLSCIVIDDELFAITQLMEYLAMMPNIGTVKAYCDPQLALADIIKSDVKVDLLFTDVEMPNMSGIDLVKKIRNKVGLVILVSSHLQYAIDGYHINAQHFLFKPFNFKSFQKVVDQLTEKIAYEIPAISIRQGKKYTKILVDDIIVVEAALNYVKIHTKLNVFLIYNSMKCIENDLKPYKDFIRINKSFIISKNYIRKVEGKRVFMENELVANIGSTYRVSLVKLLDAFPTFQKNESKVHPNRK